MTAQNIIDLLNLVPHPEGGHYRQTWIEDTSADPANPRPAGTCIYFLLDKDEHSHWHKVDSTEIWHHYAGAPVELRVSPNDRGPAMARILGSDLFDDQRPQAIVPAHHWQAAKCLGDWSLVGCTVSPGFDFAGFQLAPPDFDIPTG